MRTLPLQPQNGKGKEGSVVKQTARHWLKTVRWGAWKCAGGKKRSEDERRERKRKRSEEGGYCSLWPETAVSLRCVEDGSLLISSPSCNSIYVARLWSLVGQRPTSFKRERKKINLTQQRAAADLHGCNPAKSFCWWESFFCTEVPSPGCGFDVGDLTLVWKTFSRLVLLAARRLGAWLQQMKTPSCSPQLSPWKHRRTSRGRGTQSHWICLTARLRG